MWFTWKSCGFYIAILSLSLKMNEGVTAQQRKFVNEVRRCDELERKIRYATSELKKDGFKVVDLMEDFPPAPKPKEIIELESLLEKTETEIIELSANNVRLRTNFLEFAEMIQVLQKTDQFFSEQESHNFDTNKRGTHRDPEQCDGSLGFVAGVIRRERQVGIKSFTSCEFRKLLLKLQIYKKRT